MGQEWQEPNAFNKEEEFRILAERFEEINSDLQEKMQKIAIILHNLWLAEEAVKEYQSDLDKLRSEYVKDMTTRESIAYDILQTNPDFFKDRQ